MSSCQCFQGLRTKEPTQLLRPRGVTEAEDLHRFVVRSLVKRSTDTEPQTAADDMADEALETSEDEEARRGHVSFSITANFQALQQKLMRELWSRNPSNRVRIRSECSKIINVIIIRMLWPDQEYWDLRDESRRKIYNFVLILMLRLDFTINCTQYCQNIQIVSNTWTFEKEAGAGMTESKN